MTVSVSVNVVYFTVESEGGRVCWRFLSYLLRGSEGGIGCVGECSPSH